jgi:hypothetical protein
VLVFSHLLRPSFSFSCMFCDQGNFIFEGFIIVSSQTLIRLLCSDTKQLLQISWQISVGIFIIFKIKNIDKINITYVFIVGNLWLTSLTFEILHFNCKRLTFLTDKCWATDYSVFFMCLWYWSWTQGLALARQALYHLSNSICPFCVDDFWDRFLLYDWIHPGTQSSYLCLSMWLGWQVHATCPAMG